MSARASPEPSLRRTRKVCSVDKTVINPPDSGNRGGTACVQGEDLEENSELKREGLSIRAISRQTGYSRGTISKYLLAPRGRPVYGSRPEAVGKLDPFKPYLNERLQAGV
jgi:hypothetical protein